MLKEDEGSAAGGSCEMDQGIGSNSDLLALWINPSQQGRAKSDLSVLRSSFPGTKPSEEASGHTLLLRSLFNWAFTMKKFLRPLGAHCSRSVDALDKHVTTKTGPSESISI